MMAMLASRATVSMTLLTPVAERLEQRWPTPWEAKAHQSVGEVARVDLGGPVDAAG